MISKLSGAKRSRRRVKVCTEALTTSVKADACSLAISTPVEQLKYLSGCLTSSSLCDRISIRPLRGILANVTVFPSPVAIWASTEEPSGSLSIRSIHCCWYGLSSISFMLPPFSC